VALAEAAGKSATFRLWVQFVPGPGFIEILCDRCHSRVIGIHRNMLIERPLVDILREHRCGKK
jgi:hypothetical protein